MGLFLSKIWRRLFSHEQEFKLVIIGLQNAGKTTILYKLALGQVIIARPTIGSNVEEVRNKNVKFQVWDLGGQENLRQAWSTYYESTHAVIFVVDSADETNADLAKLEFHSMLLNPALKDAAILVFANKQDLPTAKGAEEIAEKFGLPYITDHEWHIQSCCAITGEGLKEGLDWITAKLLNKAKQVPKEQKKPPTAKKNEDMEEEKVAKQ